MSDLLVPEVYEAVSFMFIGTTFILLKQISRKGKFHTLFCTLFLVTFRFPHDFV